jgi:uncharacterized membrane protein
MNRADLKASAKSQIKGKIGILFLITLLIGLLNGAGGVIVVGAIVVSPALVLGEVVVYLSVAKGQDAKVGLLFDGFKSFWPAFKVIFLTGFYTMCWSVLLYIPGIIKSYSYSQALYIIAENPGMKANEAITKSREMMNGHKMELFLLQLSFFWWYLLCGITFGIATIYVYPYVRTTLANFYLTLSGGSGASVSSGAGLVSGTTTASTSSHGGAAFSAPKIIEALPNGEPPKSTLPRSCLD